MIAEVVRAAATHEVVVVETPQEWAEFPILRPVNRLPMRLVLKAA